MSVTLYKMIIYFCARNKNKFYVLCSLNLKGNFITSLFFCKLLRLNVCKVFEE